MAKKFVIRNGNVIIGAASGDATALLDLQSTTRGFLKPRMTEVQRDTIASPPLGLEIINTDSGKMEYWDGSVWAEIGSGGGGGTGDVNGPASSTANAIATFSDTTGKTLLNTDITVEAGQLKYIDNTLLDTSNATDWVIQGSNKIEAQPSGDGGTVTLQSGSTGSEAGLGGNLNLYAGYNSYLGGTGNGGNVDIQAGASQSADGGQVYIASGIGGTLDGFVQIKTGNNDRFKFTHDGWFEMQTTFGGIRAAAETGGMSIIGPASAGTSTGDLSLIGGQSTENGGGITIDGGSANSSGMGGTVLIQSGNGGSGDAGPLYLQGGSSSSGTAGQVYISGGTGGAAAGGVTINGGQANNNVAGDVTINGGTSANVSAGNVFLNGGATVSGAAGIVQIATSGTARFVVSDIISIYNIEMRFLDNTNSAYVGIKTADPVNGSYTITLPPDAPAQGSNLHFNGTDYVWMRSITTVSSQSISGGGTINSNLFQPIQMRRVTGSGGPVTTSTTPFSTGSGWTDGTVIILIGQSDTNTVTVPFNNATDGALLNGDCTLGSGDTLTLIWDDTAARWLEVSRNV